MGTKERAPDPAALKERSREIPETIRFCSLFCIEAQALGREEGLPKENIAYAEILERHAKHKTLPENCMLCICGQIIHY